MILTNPIEIYNKTRNKEMGRRERKSERKHTTAKQEFVFVLLCCSVDIISHEQSIGPKIRLQQPTTTTTTTTAITCRPAVWQFMIGFHRF